MRDAATAEPPARGGARPALLALVTILAATAVGACAAGLVRGALQPPPVEHAPALRAEPARETRNGEGEPQDPAVQAGLAAIRTEEIRADVDLLASPALEGRYAPSPGYDRAARHVATTLGALGFTGVGSGGSFFLPVERRVETADAEHTRLERLLDGGGRAAFAAGTDFVPVPGCVGEASGPLVFVGFGVRDPEHGFDELALFRKEWKGALALCLEGEPEHGELLEGPAVSVAADVYAKVSALERAGAGGVLLVRREAFGGPLGVRSAWGSWTRERNLWRDLGEPYRGRRSLRIPALEVAPGVAHGLLGRDPWALGAEIEADGRPRVFEVADVVLAVASDTRRREVPCPNVVGRLPGRVPGMADEHVVIGAHLDHLGVDPRGRLAPGADDNASGVAGLLAVARALAAARPARSVLVCAFAAEEEGLLGSRELCRAPPVPRESLVAMLNLDMIGAGDPAEIVVLGTRENPVLGELLEAAQALGPTGLERVVTNRAQELWRRSDHYPFHLLGVPALFFFERVDIDEAPDYHTFRDVPAGVSAEKVASTARLVFLLSWLLCEREERPPAPRR